MPGEFWQESLIKIEAEFKEARIDID